jgi:hypothetical protein
MSDAFVPFARTRVTPRSARQPHRLVVLPPDAPQAAASLPPNSPPSPPPPAPPAPELTLERDGDRITRITLRCPCGAIHELLCTS